jgi:hypothetical protein
VGQGESGNLNTDDDGAPRAGQAAAEAETRPGFSRRQMMTTAAKAGTAVAAVAWVAPHLESVAFAAGRQGSPCPDPGNPECGTTTTSDTTPPTTEQPGFTCHVDPREIKPGGKPRFWGTGWKASSRVKVMLVGVRLIGYITVLPDGTFSHNFEVVRSVPPGTYRVEFAGFDAEGRAARCFETLVVSSVVTGQGSTTTTGDPGGGAVGAGSGSASGSGNGTLPFTGSDTGGLVALGVGAVVVGRVLYGLRDRLATRDGDATAR